MAHCILLSHPSSCSRKVQLKDVNLHVLQENTTTACAYYKYAKTTANRDLLILDQKCPLSLWDCPQEPSVIVAKTKLISFFSPDNCHQTETFWNILQLVLQTSGARAATDSAIQKKSKKDRQHFKINQLHLLAPFADVLGKKGRKEERKERKRFSALKVLFSLLFKTPISSSQINGIMHFPITCLR